MESNQSNQSNKDIGGGLLPLKRDNRDFSFVKMFGTIRKEEIPTHDFVVAEPLNIKNQFETDLCVAFAICSVSEDQEKVALSPEHFFMSIKKMKGDWVSWGSDLRTGCKVAVNVGFLEQELNPYKLKNKGRNFVANWRNWEQIKFEENVKEHRKISYFKVDGPYDTFFNFRAALWQNRHKSCSILTGLTWDSSWSKAKDGIIPKKKGTPLYGHAIKIFGQKNIDDEIYLMAQLSNGEEFGDNGIFYFPKEVINRECVFGAYMFVDYLQKQVKKICWSRYRRILEIIKKVLRLKFNRLN